MQRILDNLVVDDFHHESKIYIWLYLLKKFQFNNSYISFAATDLFLQVVTSQNSIVLIPAIAQNKYNQAICKYIDV